ncbi:MAG: hypothetical protein FWC40_00010 [Proteobacteria bacterium]|nr:hypothetical protein [Pseudomonadota bacterium]
MWRIVCQVCLCLLCFALYSSAQANPRQISSPDLPSVVVRSDRAPGRLVVRTNFRTHTVRVNATEYTRDLEDVGMVVPSNELHVIKVSNAQAEREYRVAVNPGQTLVLYVDLGSTVTSVRQAQPAAPGQPEAPTEAAMGFLTVTTETDAQVYVDGKLVTAKGPLNRHEVTSGSHTVRVYFIDSRRFSKSREVFVGRGATMSLHFGKDD